MKLISLNAWGGKLHTPLIDFIKLHSKDTDIFCFQEVYKNPAKKQSYKDFRINLFDDLSEALEGFNGDFASCQDNYVLSSGLQEKVGFDISWGLAIFVRKTLSVKSAGDFFVFGERNKLVAGDLTTLPRNVQYVGLEIDDKKFIVLNIHGVWTPGRKTDTPSRVEQSQEIIEFLKDKVQGKILVGDFNLDINTKSIQMLEGIMDNLIRIYNIKTTRNKFFPWGDKYADFTFVSKEIKVVDFQVPNLEVSDHLPMILEFS